MLDLLVVVVLLIFAFIGSRRGLIDAALAFLGSLGALILSFIIYPVVNVILKMTPLYLNINEWISNRISEINFGAGVQAQGRAITENITWLPQFVGEALVRNNNTEVYKVLGVQNVVDYVSISITNVVISMLAVLITWFILKCVLVGGLRMVGNMIAKLPVISSFNHFGGFCIGLIKGLLTFWIVTLIIPCIIAIPAYQSFETYIQTSILFKWLYENNLVVLALQQLF